MVVSLCLHNIILISCCIKHIEQILDVCNAAVSHSNNVALDGIKRVTHCAMRA